jgi:hypothetical protein
MGALGSFEGIDFLLVVGGGPTDVGGQIAVTGFPLGGGFGACAAEPAGVKGDLTAAAITCVYGFMADTAVVRAAISGHKWAFLIFANGCTKQGYHLLLDI